MIIVEYISDSNGKNRGVFESINDKTFEEVVTEISDNYVNTATSRDRIRVFEVEVKNSKEIIPNHITK